MVNGASDLPGSLKTRTAEIVYRANRPKIVKGITLYDPGRVQVRLPETHLNALLLFIAPRAYTLIGMTGEFNAGNNYAVKYVAECNQLTLAGLRVDQGGGLNQRFNGRGWA